MILKEVEDDIEGRKKGGEFIYPLYEKYCFSNIPPTILGFFGVKNKRPALPPELYEGRTEGSNKVVLVLIDGLGYNQWLQYSKNYEFFNAFTKEGLVAPITAVFPSTTASALTTINTDLTPQEHGLLEWIVYFKEIDMIIKTLPFAPLGEKCQDRLLEMGVDPKILYSGGTIHQTLKEAGIKSFAFVNGSYAFSSYSKLVHKAANIIPFINSSDLVVGLKKCLEKERGPAYFYVYIGDMDSVEHKYGPHTDEHRAELSALSYLFKKELLEKIDKKAAKETTIMVTADHGQLNILPRETIYLNRYKKLADAFQRGRKRKPILPTGGPRDVFLHIKPDMLEEAHGFLSNRLKGKAKVMKTDEAIKTGLFGIGEPIKEFYERVGNLLILPYKNNTVWYEHIKGKRFELLGHHGGLSRDEMLVPFAVAKLSDLT